MPGQDAQEAVGRAEKPGLKDPLQAEPTAYEILGLGRAATDADVQKAFAMGVARRLNVQKLTTAKRILQNPVDRAVLDLFQYVPAWADRLTPSPLQPSVLDPVRRASTAQAWENQLRAGFPDPGVAHSLALLWYWWAVREEEKADTAAVAPISLDEMWRKAIAAWAMVLSNDEVWQSTLGVTGEIATQATSAIIARLNSHLHEGAQRHRSNNSTIIAARYQELELALANELRTAKQIAAAGMRTGRGKIACGVLMLEQVGLLETVRTQVEAGLKRSPSSEHLRKLQSGLSQHASIMMLIDDNRPQAALETLDALSHNEQRTPEVRCIRVRALHALAQQRVTLGNVENALTNWEEALRLDPDAEMKSAISSALVSGCQTRATALQHHQPDAAIALLERALPLADDAKLKLLLAELLTNRGIKRINDAQNSVKPGGSSDAEHAKHEIKAGVDDLERAVRYGSRRAAEQVAAARDLYKQFSAYVDSGAIYLTPGAATALGKAREAAAGGRHDEAIQLLRSALAQDSGRSASMIQKELAELYTARAIQQVNGATAEAQSGADKRQRHNAKEIATYLRANGFLGFVCWLCCVPLFATDSAPTLATWLARKWLLIPLVVPLMLAAIVAYYSSNTSTANSPSPNDVCITIAILAAIILARPLLRRIVGGRRGICNLCFGHIQYQVTVPGRGSYVLCEEHAKGLEQVMNAGTTGFNNIKPILDRAVQDLSEAIRCDPQSTHARGALTKVIEMRSQL